MGVSFRLRSDMTNNKELPLIGTGVQHCIDSYFWNLPFASVRQCKFVMDKAFQRTSGCPSVLPLLLNTTFQGLVNSSQKVLT